MTFLPRAFFERPLLTVAREVVGCTLVWDGCAGRIVEVEAYAAEGDAACHTMTRPSAREFVARHPAGTAYVYLNYGMYWLLNILVKGGGHDGLLLFRALEPTEGIETMRARRDTHRLENLCSGPGKLGRALAVTRTDHGCLLAVEAAGRKTAPPTRGMVLPTGKKTPDLVEDGRIGITRATDLPWRFSLRGSTHVSVRPR